MLVRCGVVAICGALIVLCCVLVLNVVIVCFELVCVMLLWCWFSFVSVCCVGV